MIARLKIFLAILLASCSLLALSINTYAVGPNPLEDACDSTAKAKASPLCQQAELQLKEDPIAGTNGIISRAADIIAIVAALAAVINIIIGAFEFVTAGGTGFKSQVASDGVDLFAFDVDVGNKSITSCDHSSVFN